MKRKLLLITCTLSVLTGCGSAKTTANTPSTEPIQNTADSTPTTDPSPEENLDFYIGQIVEFPVEVSGIRWSFEKTPELYNLCMTEPTILELGDGFLTAKGILTNEVFSSFEEVTVQYNFSEYEGVNLLSNSQCLTEGNVTLAPAVPFSTDFLYDDIDTVAIFPKEGSLDYIEYPFTKDSFTIELSEDGWEDHFAYKGIITVIDTEGNVYQTTIDYDFSYTGSNNDYQWEMQQNSISVRPIE